MNLGDPEKQLHPSPTDRSTNQHTDSDTDSIISDFEEYHVREVGNEAIENVNGDLNLHISTSLDRTVSRELAKIKTLPPLADDDPFFDKFSSNQKNTFVAIVALTCFLSPVSNLAFAPAIPEVAADLNTTSQIINVTNAVFNVFMAFSPMMLSPLAAIYGKKIVLFGSSVGFTLCTVLTAVSVNLPMFFIFRALSAFSGTCCFSVGGSIVGDIRPPKERGRAMSWVLMGTQLGPCFGPVAGGLIVTYTSWRVIFWVIAGLGVFDCICIWFLLQETSRIVIAKELRKATGKRFVFVKYNPLRVIHAFTYLNLVFAAFMSSSLIYNMYGLLTPIRHTINPRFNLTSPVKGALFYLPPGFGYLIGGYIGGAYADHTTKKWIEKRGGVRVSEDRLKSSLIAHGLIEPISIIIYGWALEKKKGGMALPIVAMFFNAVGQTISFTSLNSYCVDCLPALKGDAIASNYVARYILGGAVSSATCLIQIENIGIGWTSTISAFVLCVGAGSGLCLILFGAKLREQAMKKFERNKGKST